MGKGREISRIFFAPARSNPKSVCGSNVPKSRNRAEPKFQSGLYFRVQTFVSSRMGNPNGNDLAWRTIRIDIRPICIAARREMERKNRQTVGPVSLTVSLMRHFECPAVVKWLMWLGHAILQAYVKYVDHTGRHNNNRSRNNRREWALSRSQLDRILIASRKNPRLHWAREARGFRRPW